MGTAYSEVLPFRGSDDGSVGEVWCQSLEPVTVHTCNPAQERQSGEFRAAGLAVELNQ